MRDTAKRPTAYYVANVIQEIMKSHPTVMGARTHDIRTNHIHFAPPYTKIYVRQYLESGIQADPDSKAIIDAYIDSTEDNRTKREWAEAAARSNRPICELPTTLQASCALNIIANGYALSEASKQRFINLDTVTKKAIIAELTDPDALERLPYDHVGLRKTTQIIDLLFPPDLDKETNASYKSRLPDPRSHPFPPTRSRAERQKQSENAINALCDYLEEYKRENPYYREFIPKNRKTIPQQKRNQWITDCLKEGWKLSDDQRLAVYTYIDNSNDESKRKEWRKAAEQSPLSLEQLPVTLDAGALTVEELTRSGREWRKKITDRTTQTSADTHHLCAGIA